MVASFHRLIQRQVQDPLALALLRGEFGEGDEVQVDVRDGVVVFDKAEAVTTA